MSLDAQIEALLFWKAEAISVKRLADILNVSVEQIREALTLLQEKLQGRGLTLIFWEDEVTLSTSKEVSGIIEKLTKEELVRDLGKAGLETISIILYQNPVSRAEIDYIRGVNSNFILRNLLVRGLIEKVPNPNDQRSFLYKPTFEFLSHLGVSRIEDVPEYEKVRSEIEAFKHTNKELNTETKEDPGHKIEIHKEA